MRRLADLRAYVGALEELGELQQIDAEVSLDYELGAIVRRSYDLMAPAPLFTNMTGVEPGFRVLGAPAGVSAQPGLYLARVALSLGLPPESTGAEVVAAIVAGREADLIPPRLVSTGPCKEVIAVGDEVDLTRLPAPLLHGNDGGRFLNTYGIIVARTPDGSWTNWSISRTQSLDAHRMTGLVVPTQHLGVIHAMWRRLGQDMPVAVVMGTEPVIPFVGGMPIPEGVNEADFIGGYIGEPLDVVRCETVDLEVPATAEIVIEGTLSVSEVAPEGPMGEFPGFTYPGDSVPKPIYNVTALTHRTDPILPVVVAGHPVEENHTAWGIPNSAEVVYQLRRRGVPVTSAFMPLESGCQWLVITVPFDWRDHFPGPISALMDSIAEVLWRSHTAYAIAKIMVTEDDVDPSDTREVVWAFAAKHSPSDGVRLYENRPMVPLPVFLPAADRARFMTTKVIYNCLTREDFEDGAQPVRSTFTTDWSPDIQERVLRRWDEYGYDGSPGVYRRRERAGLGGVHPRPGPPER
jgi:4-hydroxy-3-polyprenylbenzoate decarboxylase